MNNDQTPFEELLISQKQEAMIAHYKKANAGKFLNAKKDINNFTTLIKVSSMKRVRAKNDTEIDRSIYEFCQAHIGMLTHTESKTQPHRDSQKIILPIVAVEYNADMFQCIMNEMQFSFIASREIYKGLIVPDALTKATAGSAFLAAKQDILVASINLLRDSFYKINPDPRYKNLQPGNYKPPKVELH